MRLLDRAARELDSCHDIQSGWKHLRTRLHDDRIQPLRRHLQSLRNARPHPNLDHLEKERRSLGRLPLRLRPRLWRYQAGNACLKLAVRLLRR